jgi:hypothetical protein
VFPSSAFASTADRLRQKVRRGIPDDSSPQDAWCLRGVRCALYGACPPPPVLGVHLRTAFDAILRYVVPELRRGRGADHARLQGCQALVPRGTLFIFLHGWADEKQRHKVSPPPAILSPQLTTTVPNPHQHIHTIMASPPTHAHASWHVENATSLPEIWARIAVFSGPIGAWQLTGVCRAAREGAKEHLRSLPGLVVVYKDT